MEQMREARHGSVGVATGALLGAVVSGGIVLQRLVGATLTAVLANTATTLAGVVAVYLTARVLADRPRFLAWSQGLGALVAVLLVHLLLRCVVARFPWVREEPRQLVNDLVGVFGLLSVVWGCARADVRPAWLVSGLGLLLVYEASARFWHLDAPLPGTPELPWSTQRFVGSEVTASGLGVLAFRLVFA